MGKLKHTGGLLGEFWGFAMENKVYWIVPLVLVFLFVAFVVIAGQSTMPFIYALF